MSLTIHQLDRLDEIMFNLPLEETTEAIAKLSPEARSVLEGECIQMAIRLSHIILHVQKSVGNS